MEQWWAVVDADGNLVSEGSALDLQPGQSKVAVDGPGEGRAWDAAGQTWGDLPEPAPVPPPAEAVLPVLATIAADSTKSRDERVDAILAALAAAAPDTEDI